MLSRSDADQFGHPRQCAIPTLYQPAAAAIDQVLLHIQDLEHTGCGRLSIPELRRARIQNRRRHNCTTEGSPRFNDTSAREMAQCSLLHIHQDAERPTGPHLLSAASNNGEFCDLISQRK